MKPAVKVVNRLPSLKSTLKPALFAALGFSPLLSACGEDQPDVSESEMPDEAQLATEAETNPLLIESSLPYGLPPFDQISNEHYLPAYERAMAIESEEIEQIANNPEPATFANTIVAMERTGQELTRVARIFSNVNGANTNPDLQAVQREMAPRVSAHNDSISLNPELFARVSTLYAQREELALDPESDRLLERYHTSFVRAGAQLDEEQKQRLREINSELARLRTQFTQNVLAEVNASAVVVDTCEELAGLSNAQIQAAADEAASRGEDGKYVITLRNTSGQPPLASLENRALRERIQKASVARGSRGNEFDMGGYSAGYYSYIWSEVLDADAVQWFIENGGMLRANGDRFRDTLLSRGGSVEAMQLYQDFAGRLPDIEHMLRRRGLQPQ